MSQEVQSLRESVADAAARRSRLGERAIDYTRYLAKDTFAIYLFHGVVTRHRHAVRNYIRKHLSLDEFSFILKSLLSQGSAVSMDTLVSAARGMARLPEYAFAVTFDDGFANNASVAAPLLKELGIPTTFYITTDFVDHNIAGGVDMIEAAVDGQDEVHITASEFGPVGTYRSRAEKVNLMDRIRYRVYHDPKLDPYAFARRFRQHVGADAFEPDAELDQKMSWEQVRSLAEEKLFTIGGHSHTHPILSHLDDAPLAREIDTSLALLKTHTGLTIQHYAYPQGLDYCYNDTVITALKARGITASPTAIEGVNRIEDDPFHWKRIMVT